jgi:hypothetical protein
MFMKPRRPGIGIASLVAMVLLSIVSLPSASGETLGEVDLALVIAVDISYSMDLDEQRLQREGYADAIRSRLVLEAVGRGARGRIAVTYMEWASWNDQRVVVPWQIIEGPETADSFVQKLDADPPRRGYRTSISGGIDYAVLLLEQAPVTAERRVIDVSGDGANNQGRAVTSARDEAVAKGISINGLPIMLKRPGYMDVENLDHYYEDCVIGGRGAFVVPIRERSQFAEATRHKLFLEVAERPHDETSLKPAQTRPRVSCQAGERQWNERMGN